VPVAAKSAAAPAAARPAPEFDAAFRDGFRDLLRWRRDVRRFRTDPVPAPLVEEIMAATAFAPSVGNSQPWRFVLVETPARRDAVLANFRRANAEALGGYRGERAQLYAGLKLSGLAEAPLVFAVFTDEATAQGHGLGRRTMPETLRYSTVTAVHTFWLAARCHGVGVGWVSILEPEPLATELDVPPGWAFTALLCVGWPEEAHTDPELERAGWQRRTGAGTEIVRR
jgi:5,6-dimethylbenzimidazole synthase